MSKKKKSEPEYEDVINFTSEPILIVKDEEMNSYLWDWQYSMLVQVLRKKAMTIREITEAFNILAKKSNFHEEKSNTSIYRYIKTLEKIGFVAQAGRRVFFDKHKTEILYSRTAAVFYYINLPKSFWDSDDGKLMYDRIYSMVSKVYDNHELDKEKFRKFIIDFERAKEKELEVLVGKLDEDVLFSVTGAPWWQIIQVLRYSDQFGVSLNQPDMLDELKKCFKTEKKT